MRARRKSKEGGSRCEGRKKRRDPISFPLCFTPSLFHFLPDPRHIPRFTLLLFHVPRVSSPLCSISFLFHYLPVSFSSCSTSSLFHVLPVSPSLFRILNVPLSLFPVSLCSMLSLSSGAVGRDRRQLPSPGPQTLLVP